SNAVRAAFSLIIIDSPPRLTTGAIQALAAGTHLLVPTVLDGPSSEAVVTFVRQVETFRKAGICPYIKYIGVVGTLAAGQDDTKGAQKFLADRLNDSWEKNGAGGVTKLLSPKSFIPRSKYFRRIARQGIAYLRMGDAQDTRPVKDAIGTLAVIVKKDMKL
ncbi:MAG: ParA family protein, partial [Hyphomicrobiaceae bacterium]